LFNSIVLDLRWAPGVPKAWQLYATGACSIDALHEQMTDLSLTHRPAKRWPREQPASVIKLRLMLQDPYYAGWVTVDGQLFSGRHEAIVSPGLARPRVGRTTVSQRPRDPRSCARSFLKGMAFCGR